LAAVLGMACDALASSRTCPCNPDFAYASAATFAHHFRSLRHQAWSSEETCRDLRRRLGLRENEVRRMQRRVEMLEQVLLDQLVAAAS
jgi:hypothetical protein